MARIKGLGDFPIKNGDFPIKNGDFPIKNGDFPIKNGDFPTWINPSLPCLPMVFPKFPKVIPRFLPSLVFHAASTVAPKAASGFLSWKNHSFVKFDPSARWWRVWPWSR